MQAIRQFDQNNPNILRHRQQHFAKVFGFGVLFGIKLDLINFANAIDQSGDIFTETKLQVFFCGRGIFNNIVEECRNNAAAVQAHLRENRGHGHRMKNIGFTTATALTLMDLSAKKIGRVNSAGVLVAQILL